MKLPTINVPHGRFALAGLVAGIALALAAVFGITEIQERDTKLDQRQKLIEQRDNLIKEQGGTIDAKDAQMRELQRQIDELNKALQAKREAQERARLAQLLVPTAKASGGVVTRPGSDYWARLRQCESGGNYATNTGNGYYGAYQYDTQTWNNYGGYRNAHEAPPEVQDRKAQETYARRGSSPWPTCG